VAYAYLAAAASLYFDETLISFWNLLILH